MDISRLLPFIKEALVTVSPEEVQAQLAKQQQSKHEDKERESVDNEYIEQDEKPTDDQDNAEGDLLEGSFKELDVEDAIEQAKEQKLLSTNPNTSTVGGSSIKTAMLRIAGPRKKSYWDILSSRKF